MEALLKVTALCQRFFLGQFAVWRPYGMPPISDIKAVATALSRLLLNLL